MSAYPEDTPRWAFCMMEGHNFRGGARCVMCGERLRCGCGRFVRERDLDAHLDSDDCTLSSPVELEDPKP